MGPGQGGVVTEVREGSGVWEGSSGEGLTGQGRIKGLRCEQEIGSEIFKMDLSLVQFVLDTG